MNHSRSAYRQANIARNTAVLAGLGIDVATSAIRAQTQQAARVFVKPEKREREPREPVRRSTRGKAPDGTPLAAPVPVEVEAADEHLAPEGPVDMRASGHYFEESKQRPRSDADLDGFATALSSLPSALPVATTTGTLAPKQTAWELGPDTSDPIARGAARVKGGLPCSQQAVLVVCCL